MHFELAGVAFIGASTETPCNNNEPSIVIASSLYSVSQRTRCNFDNEDLDRSINYEMIDVSSEPSLNPTTLSHLALCFLSFFYAFSTSII